MQKPTLIQRAFNNPLFMTLFLAVFWGGSMYIGNDHRGDDGSYLILVVVSALIFGGLMSVIFTQQLKRFNEAVGVNSLEERVTLQRALKTATLPDDPKMRDLLPAYLSYVEERQQRAKHSNRIILPLLVVIFAFNAVVQHSAWWVILGIIFVVTMFISLRANKRLSQNIPKLNAQLAAKR